MECHSREHSLMFRVFISFQQKSAERCKPQRLAGLLIQHYYVSSRDQCLKEKCKTSWNVPLKTTHLIAISIWMSEVPPLLLVMISIWCDIPHTGCWDHMNLCRTALEERREAACIPTSCRSLCCPSSGCPILHPKLIDLHYKPCVASSHCNPVLGTESKAQLCMLLLWLCGVGWLCGHA